MNKLITVKMIQQENGLYMLQAYDGAWLVREERNLTLEEAAKRIDVIKGETDATAP